MVTKCFYQSEKNTNGKNGLSTLTRDCEFISSHPWHYSDVIMSAMASQIACFSMVCSTVCSGADLRKHQSSVSLAFVRWIHRWSVKFPHKRPVTRKRFLFDDVIMNTQNINNNLYWHWFAILGSKSFVPVIMFNVCNDRNFHARYQLKPFQLIAQNESSLSHHIDWSYSEPNFA